MRLHKTHIKTFFSLGWLLFSLFLANILQAQNHGHSEHITVEDGLGYRDVYSIVESAPGHYWIGTSHGVQFYDGHNFFSLEEMVGENPIGTQQVDQLQMYKDSLLFLRVRNGLYQINTKQLTISKYKIPYEGDGEFNLYARLHDQEFWIKTSDTQAILYTNRADSFVKIDSSAFIKKIGSGFSIIRHKDYIIWASVNIGLRIFDLKENKVIRSLTSADLNYTLAVDDGGNIYFLNYQENLFKLSPPYIGKITLFKKTELNGLYDVYNSPNDNRIWLSGDRVMAIDSNGQNTNYDDFLSKLSLSIGRSVRTIYSDSQKNLWFGTIDGIFKYPSNNSLFKFHHKSIKSEKIKEMRGIFFDKDDNLLVNSESTAYGIFKIGKNGEEEILKAKDENGKESTNYNSYYPLVYDERFDKYWVSSRYYGLVLLDPDTQVFTKTSEYGDAPFIKLRSGKILFGKKITKIRLYDPLLKVSQKLNFDFPDNGNGFINSYYQLPDGHVMISSLDGIYLITLEGKILKHFSTESEPALPHNNVSMLCQDEEGLIWGATKGGGIFSLSSDFSQTQHYGLSEGLPNLWVPMVIPIKDDQIISPTFSGLSILSKSRGDFRNYYEEHGLSHNEFNTNSYYHKDSLVYLGTLDGINILNVNKLESVEPSNTINLSLIKIYDKASDSLRYYNYSHKLEQGITMTPSDTWMEVYFGISDQLSPEKNIYNYKIEGFHDKWQTIIGEGKIRIEGLPAGKYTIQLNGSNISNIPCINQLVIPLTVEDVFYNTAWFRISLGGLILSLGLFWYIRIRNENIRLEQTVEQRTKELQTEKETIFSQAEQLKELDEVKDRLFINLSHEFRTPLTLISAPLDKIADGENLSEEQKYLLGLIGDNSTILKDRIDELLDLSKITSGRTEMSTSTVFLSSLIDKSTRVFLPLASKKGISLVINQTKTDAYYLCDSRKLSKIIQNLINNAIKFTPNGGRVECVFEIQNGRLFAKVQDTGIGVSKEDKSKIFERFYQSSASFSVNQSGGIGVGLAMVKEYIDLMKGEINIESEEGSGTTISFQIPIEIAITEGIITSDKDSIVESIDPGAENTTSNVSQPTLLLVEDNVDLRLYLNSLLTEKYQVTQAGDGLEALEILQSGKQIDIVLSDLMMPNMNGVTLLQKVRSDESLRIIPFILLTAKHSEKDLLQSYQIGVDDYIMKPFKNEELLSRINAVYQNYLVRLEAKKEEVISISHDKTLQTDSETACDFIKGFEKIVLDNLDSPEFSVQLVSEELKISSRNLSRIVKKEIGLRPSEFIKEIKLSKARDLIEGNQVSTFEELSSQIGFSDSRYFKKLYFSRFGVQLQF